ncbi:lytic murein transglycosylase B [Methylomonas paludis]|uniref:Lytic murein transglycosylase B n=1 Tax=Methylomonas paludis TaxID=1173101 RepID=A0A975RAX5_9GAMM|nr:lytic murein transglycosylase B [Methylomonas paludis]QWF72602.1 lytic murein transglycosylase B [Methylomonas paludis]
MIFRQSARPDQAKLFSKTQHKIACCLLWQLLAGCAGQPQKLSREQQPVPLKPAQQTSAIAGQNQKSLPGNYYAPTLTGDYAGYPALNQFIDEMHQKHGLKREYLQGLFSQAKRKQWTLDYLSKSDHALKGKPAPGGWTKYRAQFLDERHINSGIAFWQKHQSALQRASQQYGVPAEYILGIMGVETSYGANVGNHRIIDALTTLAFDYQRRGEYFRSELENFLLMSANEGIDPAKPVGSFAGAMGLGQFMPSSFRQWAVDFNGDGHRDLWNPEDAIGSIANYFAQHGWQTDKPVVSPTQGSYAGIDNLEPGIDHSYPLLTLNQAGVAPVDQCDCVYPLHLLWLRHSSHDQYLLGHPNFYVISRYNHSTHYVMAVHELAQAIKKGYRQI